MKHKLAIALITVFSLCIFVLPLSAHAASVPRHTNQATAKVQVPQVPLASACETYHNETYCDGTSPNDTGCSAANVFTPEVANIKNASGTVIGQVQLRASGTCQTNWAKVVSYIGNATIYTQVATQDNRVEYATDYGVSSAYSPQLWTNTIQAYAYGCINQFCSWTAPY